jgi:hypothetical protein
VVLKFLQAAELVIEPHGRWRTRRRLIVFTVEAGQFNQADESVELAARQKRRFVGQQV